MQKQKKQFNKKSLTGQAKRISISTVILSICLFVLIFPNSARGALVFQYGFEDWGGTIANTPGYPFGSEWGSFCREHEAATEVVQSYEGYTAPGGNNFLLYNNTFVPLSPSVPGITQGSVEGRMNLGFKPYSTDPACGNDTFDISTITTGEFFVSFKSFISDWDAVLTDHDAKLKFVRYYQGDFVDVMWMVYQNVADNRLPQFAIDGPGTPIYGGTTVAFADGEWHKFSMYVNYNTGMTAIWMDVENETFANALISHNYGSGNLPGPGYPRPIVLINNWSANNPTEIIYHGLDDIEVWDGMPDAVTCSIYNNNQTECEANGCNYCGGICQSEACFTIRADVNQDEEINTTDASLTLRNSLGLSMAGTDWQSSATTGDVNCDGNSNSIDAMLILRYSLGLSMVGTNWCEN